MFSLCSDNKGLRCHQFTKCYKVEMLCYNSGSVGVQQNRSPFVNIYFRLPLFLFSKSQKCCINVTTRAILSYCQAILKHISTISTHRQGTLQNIRLYFRVGVLPTISTT